MLSLKQRTPPKGKTAPYSTCFPRDEGDSDPRADSGLQRAHSSGLVRDEATTRRYKPSGFRNHEEKPGWGLGTPWLFTTRQGSQQHSSPPAHPWGPHRGHRPPSPRAGSAAAPGSSRGSKNTAAPRSTRGSRSDPSPHGTCLWGTAAIVGVRWHPSGREKAPGDLAGMWGGQGLVPPRSQFTEDFPVSAIGLDISPPRLMPTVPADAPV